MSNIKLNYRMEMLKKMHEFVMSLNDEDYYMWWIMVVPDGATEDDFEYMAEDDSSYKQVCDLFKRVIEAYEEKYGEL